MLTAIDHRTRTTLWAQLNRGVPAGVEEEEMREAAPKSGGKPLPQRETSTTQPQQATKKSKPPAKRPANIPPKPQRPT